MRVVVQRVSQSNVKVSGEIIGEIKEGLMVLVSFIDKDNNIDLEWMTKKIINLRIFNDDGGKMNRSVQELDGDILLISQFTLHGSTKKGNRPSYVRAAKHDLAIPLYESFIKLCEEKLPGKVKSGVFGADMKVELSNEGPVTLILDSKRKE